MKDPLIGTGGEVHLSLVVRATPCSTCGVAAGQDCVNIVSGEYTAEVHRTRVMAFNELERTPMALLDSRR